MSTDAVAADFSAFWVYVAGPLAGAVLAVGAAFVLRGRPGRLGRRPGDLFTGSKRPDLR